MDKKLFNFLAALALSLCIIFLPTTSAWASPVQTENVLVQLISEVKNIQPGVPFWVALHFKIREGWHIYWRNPGDSGMAATIDWKLPNGFSAGDIVWPYPKRFPIGPLVNFGYEDEVTLPIEVTPPANLATNNSVELIADTEWLVCQVDCIPESGTLNLTLPLTNTSAETNQKWADVFETTRQALPKTAPWSVTATIEEEELVLRFEAPEMQKAQIEQIVFFPDRDGVITNAAPQEAVFDQKGLSLKLQPGYLTSQLEQVSGVLVIEEALDKQTVAQAFAIQARVITGETTPSTPPSNLPIWKILLLALLGGIVLNLMPCVFPVLSLKALNIVQKAQKSRKQLALQSLAFTAGVLASFTVIVGVLLTLRSLGVQVGWGFQLQSPLFVTLMAYLMFAVGLSLSGVFVFGASLMGIGQGLAAKEGYAGEFFTGVFATVVATPCTAPFMATAIGVALTQPPLIAIAIFEFLGLGLALPYVAISLTPKLQQLLPKPGASMETFQQLLAFPMYAATAWLIWVLAQQAGTTGLAAGLTGLISIGFAAWLYQKTRLVSTLVQRLGTLAALAVLGFALTVAQLPRTISTDLVSNPTQGIAWEAYSADRLAQLRQSGRNVFVNFSASWCITCLVNERVALNQPETIAVLEAKNVALLKGDWTNRDRSITKALESFGRSGVPLYVLYSSQSNQPIVLPQILTPDQVQSTIEDL